MEIIFAGICCWVDAGPERTGKTVIIRNALDGGIHGASRIPPHNAFIHAKRDQVDARAWTHDWSGGEDNLLFYLAGDYVSFDPTSSGGSIHLGLVPHVFANDEREAICPAAEEIRTGFLHQPNPSKVLGLVDVPADADVRSEANPNNAVYVVMTIPSAPVTITATPFDGGPARSLVVTDPNARVFVANVTISEYLNGVGARDDAHQYLVCDIFKPKTASARGTADRAARPNRNGAAVKKTRAEMAALEDISLFTLRRAANRDMNDFLNTLAAGCSDSQWP